MAELGWSINMKNERQWFVVYTKANSEKKFAVQVNLLQSDCEAFLPLIDQARQWSDRTKVVSVPLFKSYVFVYIDGNEFQQLKRLPGFVSYIKFNNLPAVISQQEMKKIQRFISTGKVVEVLSNRLLVGTKVEIVSGNLQGYCGILVERRNQQLVAIEVEGLAQSMMLTLPEMLLKPIVEV
ncbi:UpxY family transcription antiterminator [Pseudoalteromonas fuliginea]|nr:UpxY family transcription antiterminator [Pseudoalteromonas fuliginea]